MGEHATRRRRLAAVLIIAALGAGAAGPGLLGPLGHLDPAHRADGIPLVRLPTFRAPMTNLGARVRNSTVLVEAADPGGLSFVLHGNTPLDPSTLTASRQRLRDLGGGEFALPDDLATSYTWRETEYSIGQQRFRGFRSAISGNPGGPEKVVQNARFALVEQSVGGTGPDFTRLPTYVTKYLDPDFTAQLGATESAGAGADTYLPLMVDDPGIDFGSLTLDLDRVP